MDKVSASGLGPNDPAMLVLVVSVLVVLVMHGCGSICRAGVDALGDAGRSVPGERGPCAIAGLKSTAKETPAYEWASGGPLRWSPDALTVSRFLMLRVADVDAMYMSGGGGLA